METEGSRRLGSSSSGKILSGELQRAVAKAHFGSKEDKNRREKSVGMK